jgi:hypothetical protein
MVIINREVRKAEFVKRGRIPSQSIKKLVTTTIAVFTVLIFTMGVSAFARECSDLAPNAKIDCSVENMVTEFSNLSVNLDELESVSQGKFSISSTALNDKVTRMDRMRERSKNSGAFKNLARKQDLYKTGTKKASGSSCFVLEENWETGGNSKDQNIICGDTPGEKCAESCPDNCEDPDTSLDCPCNSKWDGVCKGKEVCEECCEGDDKCETAWEEYMGDPESGTEPIDDEATDEIAASFQEAADAVKKLNDSAVELTFAMDSYNGLMSSADEVHDQRCSQEDLSAVSVVAKTTDFMKGALTAYAATSAAHDSCDSAANEDVLGFNGSAVCVVTAVAKGIAYGVFEKSEFLYDVSSSDMLTNLTKCSTALSEGLDGIEDGIQEVDKKIVDLQKIMIERFDEVNTLLNTPQGQRPDFPVK